MTGSGLQSRMDLDELDPCLLPAAGSRSDVKLSGKRWVGWKNVSSVWNVLAAPPVNGDRARRSPPRVKKITCKPNRVKESEIISIPRTISCTESNELGFNINDMFGDKSKKTPNSTMRSSFEIKKRPKELIVGRSRPCDVPGDYSELHTLQPTYRNPRSTREKNTEEFTETLTDPSGTSPSKRKKRPIGEPSPVKERLEDSVVPVKRQKSPIVRPGRPGMVIKRAVRRPASAMAAPVPGVKIYQDQNLRKTDILEQINESLAGILSKIKKVENRIDLLEAPRPKSSQSYKSRPLVLHKETQHISLRPASSCGYRDVRVIPKPTLNRISIKKKSVQCQTKPDYLKRAKSRRERLKKIRLAKDGTKKKTKTPWISRVTKNQSYNVNVPSAQVRSSALKESKRRGFSPRGHNIQTSSTRGRSSRHRQRKSQGGTVPSQHYTIERMSNMFC